MKILESVLYIAFIFLIAFVVLVIPTWVLQNYGWVWNAIPFWIPSLLFGFIVIVLTYALADRDSKSIKNIFSGSKHFELEGYLFGFVLVFASIIWFFLPQNVIKILPLSSSFFIFYCVFALLLVGMGEILSDGIAKLLNRRMSGVIGCLIALVCFSFINFPIWSYTETLPLNYYSVGKLFFIIMILFQILYVTIFHLSSVSGESKKNTNQDEI